MRIPEKRKIDPPRVSGLRAGAPSCRLPAPRPSHHSQLKHEPFEGALARSRSHGNHGPTRPPFSNRTAKWTSLIQSLSTSSMSASLGSKAASMRAQLNRVRRLLVRVTTLREDVRPRGSQHGPLGSVVLPREVQAQHQVLPGTRGHTSLMTPSRSRSAAFAWRVIRLSLPSGAPPVPAGAKRRQGLGRASARSRAATQGVVYLPQISSNFLDEPTYGVGTQRPTAARL